MAAGVGPPDDGHDAAACARAWQTLRLAHNRVATRLAARLADGCGLTLNEFDALLYLRARADAETRLTELLEAVPLSQPALSRLVARLEARGAVTRCGTHHDRRATLVRLTPAGHALVQRAAELHAAVVREALTDKFTPDEQAALLRILGQIGT